MAREPKFETILLDADGVLFDFEAAQKVALNQIVPSPSPEQAERILEIYEEHNNRLWAELESGDTDPETLKVERFRLLAADLQLTENPHVMSERYLEALSSQGILLPDAYDVVRELAQSCRLILLTNGLGDVQRPRLRDAGLEPFFDAVIVSEEWKIAKPDPRIFHIALKEGGHPRNGSVLMVGDSLSSDIVGARRAGIPSCWYAPKTLEMPNPPPNYRIHALTELFTVIFDD